MTKWIALVGALITLVSVLLIEARKRRKQRAKADAIRDDAISEYGDARGEPATRESVLERMRRALNRKR